MSITAAQLVAEVAINGADSGISNLTQIGAASDGAQAALDRTSSAADALSQVFAAQQQAISADGEAYMSLQAILAETDSYLSEQVSAVTSDGEAVVSLGTVMADLAAQADATAMQIAAESEAEAQAASNAAYLAMTAGEVAPALETTASAATQAATSVSEAGTAARESGGGFIDMVGKLGMGIMSLQGLISMAGQAASALFAPAISAEEISSSLVVFTGSAEKAKQELAALADFASHTPFETTTIDNAALKMQSVGINAKDVIPYIHALGDALDATGRISSADLDMIVNDFDKIKTTGHLTTDVMNSFALQGIDAWAVLEKQTGKTHEQLAALISKGLYPAKDAMRDLTEGIEKNPLYKGQMANDTANFTGAVSTMKSNFEGVLVQFGSPILKAVEPIINNLSAAFASQGFKDFAGSIGKGIVSVFDGIGGTLQYVGNVLHSINLTPFNQAWHELSGVVGTLVGHFQNLGSALSPVKGDFDPIADAIQKIGKAGLGALTDFIRNLAQGLADLAKSGAVTGFLKTLGDGFSQLQKIVGGDLGKDFQLLGKTVQDLGKWFQTTMLPAIQQAMPGFEHLGTVLATTVVPALAKIWTVGQQVARDALPPLIKAFETIEPIVVKVAGWLANQLGNALQFLAPFAVQAAQALGQFASEIISRVQPIVEGIYSTIKIFLDWIAPYWPQIWGQIQNDFTAVWDIIKGAIQIAWAIVSGTVKVGLDLFSGNWKQAWKDIQDAFGGAWDGIKSIVSGVWTAIGGSVKGGINAVIDMINGFIRGIDSIHVNVAGVNIGFNVPTIPHLATGGRLTRGGVVELGELGPEQVYLPAGAEVMPHGQSFGGGSGQPINLKVDVYLNGDRMSAALMPGIVNNIRWATGVRF